MGGGSLSDALNKRFALAFEEPGTFLGTQDPTNHCTPDTAIPESVNCVLQQFSPALLEVHCMPQSTDIDALLLRSFSHEHLLPHNRLAVTDDEAAAALNLVNAAIVVHLTSLYNSRNDEEQDSWYPVVRRLLSVTVENGIAVFPGTDAPLCDDDFLGIIDVRSKLTTSILPPVANVELDMLVIFNGRHDPSVRRALKSNFRLNPFADVRLARVIVALGVEIKAAGGGGQVEAEYNLGLWGTKTLRLTRRLANQWDEAKACNVAVGLSVCGHVWSMHLTYWRRNGGLVTHGPVYIGGTDTLYGTMKIIKWVCLFKNWARTEAFVDWTCLLDEVMM